MSIEGYVSQSDPLRPRKREAPAREGGIGRRA
jgi:hypothetical protein